MSQYSDDDYTAVQRHPDDPFGDSAKVSPFECWWESEPPGSRAILFEPVHVIAEKSWKAALEWAAGQVEIELEDVPPDEHGGDTKAAFLLRRLAAKIREGQL